jgi:hypothetical protein
LKNDQEEQSLLYHEEAMRLLDSFSDSTDKINQEKHDIEEIIHEIKK